MTVDASSVDSTASARTAAARTSASWSFSMRSTAGPQRARRGRPGRLERAQRPRPHVRRLVMQQQRRDQVALVERLEHVDGVQHATTRRDSTAPRPASRSSPRRRRRGARPPARSSRVSMLRRNRFRYSPRARIAIDDPEARHDQAGVAQALPVEVQSPRLDEHEQQQRSQRLREPIDRDVDERLRAVFQISTGSGRNSTSRVVLSMV